MTYFPLRQTTCFFIPLVAPCKPLLSRDEKMPRFIPIKSVMIDSSNYRYQNGSDVYISRVVKDFLEPEDITAITQAHRNMIDEFAQNEAIQSIYEKISAASTVMKGKLSLSADQEV